MSATTKGPKGRRRLGRRPQRRRERWHEPCRPSKQQARSLPRRLLLRLLAPPRRSAQGGGGRGAGESIRLFLFLIAAIVVIALRRAQQQ